MRSAFVRFLGAAMIGVCGVGDATAADDGYTASLFDGRSLRGWTAENGCEAAVQDGAILLKSGDGWLRSDLIYTDFTLHVEWKALKDADYDAGIYLRAQADGKPFPKHGYQVNLLQGKEGNIHNLPGAASSGLIRSGEWNTFDITCRGETVSLKINGQPAYSVSGATIPSGYVGIQVEVPKGGQFLLRNLRITELHHHSLLDGDTLTHWEGAGQPAEVCWELKEGVLHCTQGKGPWLRSREQYGDFNLRLDYRLGAGGNSGVYVRVPANGNHHRADDQQPPAGFEVQILDDAAPKHAKLKDYQYSASVYDIAAAHPRNSRPAGEWNTLEINCRGQHVTTTHNGRIVVNITATDHPLLNLRQEKGYLGLQNHGAGVDFRNMRLGPAIEYPAP